MSQHAGMHSRRAPASLPRRREEDPLGRMLSILPFKGPKSTEKQVRWTLMACSGSGWLTPPLSATCHISHVAANSEARAMWMDRPSCQNVRGDMHDTKSSPNTCNVLASSSGKSALPRNRRNAYDERGASRGRLPLHKHLRLLVIRTRKHRSRVIQRNRQVIETSQRGRGPCIPRAKANLEEKFDQTGADAATIGAFLYFCIAAVIAKMSLIMSMGAGSLTQIIKCARNRARCISPQRADPGGFALRTVAQGPLHFSQIK